MNLRPWYNKDANYQTNAKSFMDYLARTNKFLEVLIEDYEVFQELVNEELETILFDSEMAVDDILVNWLEDGTLARIINDGVLGNKADKKDVEDVIQQLLTKADQSELDQTNTQLAHVQDKIMITPSDFEGSDIEKIQKTYDYCVEHNIRDVRLDRTYDLTGGSIFLKNGYFIGDINFYDGGFSKSDEGFMFTRENTESNSTNSPSFYGVRFEGSPSNVVYISNGDKMIRQRFISCSFLNINAIKTVGYTQSVRLLQNTMYNATAPFIKSTMNLDMNISHNDWETSRFPLVETISSSTGQYANSVFRFNNNLIEGYLDSPTLVMSSGLGVSINSNYFEYNKGHIQFVDGGGLLNISGEINGNYFTRNEGNYDIEFDGHIIGGLDISNNVSNIRGENKAFTNKVPGNAALNYLYAGGKQYPTGTYTVRKGLNLVNTVATSENGLTVEIELRGLVNNLIGSSYLVNIGAPYASSTRYRANYVGILTLDGHFNSTADSVRAHVKLHHLSLVGVGGNTNGTDAHEDDIDVFFSANNLDHIDIDGSHPKVKINFNQLTHHSEYTNVSIKPITNLLLEQGVYSQ